MKYAFIAEHVEAHSASALCSVIGVSTSGYYDWRQRRDKPSERANRTQAIDTVVKQCFERKKQRYGSPRVALELVKTGCGYNEKTVAESMKRQGLVAKAGRKFKATTNSKHTLGVAPNLLEQDFTTSAANQKWCGDITYLWTPEGWLYLATVLDLFSRKIIGWSMNAHMTSDLVCDALQMALQRRDYPTDVIVHTDRGSQYCSKLYQRLIKKHELQCSMSKKGDCFDNACAETFFHTLKVEAIHGENIPTRELMREAVFEFIELDYNRTRMHSALGYLSPLAFELQESA